MTEISNEYGNALFLLACECGEEETVLSELESAVKTFSENEEYLDFLSTPSISKEERTASIESVFSALSEHTVSFIALLCEKGHIRSFCDCVSEYRSLYNARIAVSVASVTSAVPLTEEEKSALCARLGAISGGKVRLECTVDPSILGGVIVEMDGKVTDGSLRHRLNEVKEVMNR